MRSRWLLVAGLILALAGGVLTFAYLRSLDRRVPVIVAARDLFPRDLIGPADVRTVYLDPEAVLPGGLRETQGRWVVNIIFAGEQITSARTELSLVNHCAWGLGGAYRAMFVPAGYGKAAGAAVRPGDQVDLVAVTTGYGDSVAYRLGVGLRVLELRDERGQTIPLGPAKTLLGGVLLAVPDYLIEPIALALSCGQVYIVLRDPSVYEEQMRSTGDLDGETR